MKKLILIIVMVMFVGTVFAKVDKGLFNAIKEKIPALSQEQRTELKTLLHDGKIETKGIGFQQNPMTERILTFFLAPWAQKISLITLSKGKGELAVFTTKGKLYTRDIHLLDTEEIQEKIIPEIKKELGFK